MDTFIADLLINFTTQFIQVHDKFLFRRTIVEINQSISNTFSILIFYTLFPAFYVNLLYFLESSQNYSLDYSTNLG